MTDSAKQTEHRQKIQQAKWDSELRTGQNRSELESILISLAVHLEFKADEVFQLRACIWGANLGLKKPSELVEGNFGTCESQSHTMESETFHELQIIALEASKVKVVTGKGITWVRKKLHENNLIQADSFLDQLEWILQPLNLPSETVT